MGCDMRRRIVLSITNHLSLFIKGPEIFWIGTQVGNNYSIQYQVTYRRCGSLTVRHEDAQTSTQLEISSSA